MSPWILVTSLLVCGCGASGSSASDASAGGSGHHDASTGPRSHGDARLDSPTRGDSAPANLDAHGAPSVDGGMDASSTGLDPTLPPGENFDLSDWELQEPVGSPGAPTTISPPALDTYHDSYFFTDPTDGAMTFWDPEDGVTTPNSNYPRCELRELNPDGSGANWKVAGTNTLSATVEAVSVPDKVVVGQIHLGTAIEADAASSTKPLLELYWEASGNVVIGIERDPLASGETETTVANVPVGTRMSYEITLQGDGTISLTVNGKTSTFTMPSSMNAYGMYFKAGNYDQSVGLDASVSATVKFYALHVSHA
jgi:hypothetical protein